MKKYFTKERLIYLLLIVSILSISFFGINQLVRILPGFFSSLGNAAKSVIIPFSIAFLFTFIINPLSFWIEKKTKLSRSVSIILSMVIGLVFILGVLSITLTFIISQLVTVSLRLIEYLDNEAFKGFIENLVQIIQNRLDTSNIQSLIDNFESYGLTPSLVSDWLGSIFTGLRSVTSSIVQLGMILILTPVFMYYLMKDKDTVFNGILHVFPHNSQKHIHALALETDKVIKGYFTGYGIVMVFITVFFAITYSILSFFIPGFNLGHAILFALVMGVFSIIPYIGVWIAMSMPVVLFLSLHFESANPKYVYFVAIAMVFLLNIIEEAIESTLVQPKVYSKQVRIHPLAVLSSFIFFGAIFGLVGLILAVPIAGTIKVSFNYFKTLNSEEENKREIKEDKEAKDEEVHIEEKETEDKK